MASKKLVRVDDGNKILLKTVGCVLAFCVFLCVVVCGFFLGLTVHGQVRRRLHLTGRVGSATRVDSRILRISRLDQQDCVVTFLDHLLRSIEKYK